MARNKGCRALVLGLSVLATMVFSASSMARPVRCLIAGAGLNYRGKCDFTPSGGSFSISPIGRASFPGGVNPVSVAVVAPGVAEVRGLTREGINSRWGEARRSKRDPACWEGSDFRICAY